MTKSQAQTITIACRVLRNRIVDIQTDINPDAFIGEAHEHRDFMCQILEVVDELTQTVQRIVEKHND